jgi:hypothetical protein
MDEWIVMPDHVHLLIELGNWDYNNGFSTVGKIHEFSLHESPIKPHTTDEQIKLYRAERRRMIIPKILENLKC